MIIEVWLNWLQEWGAESPLHFVSNANVLDALVGNAPRDCRLFAEGLHWVHWGQRRPMLLDHPRSAPDNSKPRSIWTPGVINFKGLRVTSFLRFLLLIWMLVGKSTHGSCALLINEHNNSILFVRLLKMKNIIYERIPFIRLQSYKVTVLVCHPLSKLQL